jgi:hypothetical protein
MKNTTKCSVNECTRLRDGNSQWCHMHTERVRRHGDTDALFVYTRHNMRYTPEYLTWKGMKTRCHNPNAAAYKYYGARGITVCDEWRGSFQAFYDHIGPRPAKGFSVERIDNDGDYEPGNVKWATRREQAFNRRTNRHIDYNGEVRTLTEWAEYLDTPIGTIFYRLEHGRDIMGNKDNENA